jgi:hypothetical protein
MFLHGVTAISWKSSKHILVAMSTNHSEIIVIYEASQECAWLRRIIDHIQISCGIGVIGPPTIIYEDNAACVAQIQIRYVKTNYMKHISPNCFIHINRKKVERLVSCKLNHVIITLIFLQILYL